LFSFGVDCRYEFSAISERCGGCVAGGGERAASQSYLRMGVPMVRMGVRTAGCRPGNDDRAPPMRLLTRS
jgi:hypothetical protein